MIPAAGGGQRFGAKKQFLEHQGWSLLRWSLEPFLKLGDALRSLMVAVPAEDLAAARKSHGALEGRVEFVAGGPTRRESVYLAERELWQRGQRGLWLVHDAARPLLEADDLARLIGVLEAGDVGGLLACRVCDTLKRGSPGDVVSGTVDRRDLWQALTPQGASAELLWPCAERAQKEGWEVTDDASLMETCGVPVRLVEGQRGNIKVTTPEDWELFCKLARRTPS